ncbi:MAG TPA: phage Gp37/Gp68 family protein [Candidatus Deferrimicrobium sp.]|nr:phage Gp37/Gp68 family protein [Candidatus Deferrimicrobium sp.]
MSRIEWTSSTWNPVTGCDKVSAGCEHCYAERMARRLQAMGVGKYRNGFKVTLHPDVLDAPLQWKKPQMIFVNSMSDLFHPEVPIEFVQRIFDVMNRANWHVFQILTKRSKPLKRLHSRFSWPENVWMGVTVESRHYTYRIDDLRQTDAKVKFLSLEPLLSSLPGLNLNGIDWVVVGGESGPGARPMKKEWVIDIQAQCRRQGVSFFFKQWGGVNKKATGRLLNGRTWDEMPSISPVLQLSL